MELKSIASQYILQLLSKRSPELGARLKQNLNSELVEKGFERFDEKLYGYKRFSDFLEGHLGDQLNVVYPKGAGDTQVSLKKRSGIIPKIVVNDSGLKNLKDSHVIRSDVWQAFTNPDSDRKRFWHKQNYSIAHFIESVDGPEKSIVLENPDQFIEIVPIGAAEQLKWMQSFLDGVKLPPTEKSALEKLFSENYSSAINATFTRALGVNSNAWRSFRTNNVIEYMQVWSNHNAVIFEDFCVPPLIKKVPSIPEPVTQVVDLTPRQQATRFLELLSDDEIASLVIPNLVNVFLLKPRV